jgi:hypothetical protein
MIELVQVNILLVQKGNAKEYNEKPYLFVTFGNGDLRPEFPTNPRGGISFEW